MRNWLFYTLAYLSGLGIVMLGIVIVIGVLPK